jgi:competence protein ComEC
VTSEALGLRYQPVVAVFGAVLAGVTCDRLLPLPIVVWSIAAVICLAIWSFVGRTSVRLGAWLVLLAGLATAAVWHHMQWRVFRVDDPGFSATVKARPVCAEVVATSSPRRQPARPFNPMNTVRESDEVHFEIRVVALREGRQWRTACGQATLRINGDLQDVRAGDRLRVFGLLTAPSPPLNPGEPDFALFERAERRLCRLQVESSACICILKKGSHVSVTYWLNRVRDYCDANLWRYVSHHRAGLAAAVLLGTREQIDPQRNEDFMTTGTVHLLSISGLHVGILAYGFWLIARLGWLSRKKTLVSAMLFVVLYAMLTDARPPVVRASVLICVVCTARFFGRQALNFNTLAAAGIVVLGLNPSSFFQAGTQLSFLAVATMASIPSLLTQPQMTDPLARLIAETRPWPIRTAREVWSGLWRAIGLSTAIWLVALPLVMYRFHLVSPVATVLNPVVCLPMAVALFAGFGVMVLGGIASPIAAVCGWVCDVCLTSMEWCIAWSLTWRGNHWWLPEPPLWWVAAFYAVAAGLVLLPFQPPRRWVAALALGWLALGGWLVSGPSARPQTREHDDLICSFIAVGHGTSVLLEFPRGEIVLYDAGRLGTAATGARSIASVIWSRGITHLDALIISHADADHFNAIPDLLERFSVGTIYICPVMFRNDTDVLSELRRRIELRAIPIRTLSSGDRLKIRGSAQVSALHPPESGVQGSDNANSIVLLVEYAGRKILLPGDLESPGLEDLLHSPEIDCDVIMAPHHGSARSDPDGFAKWSSPEMVVISGGLSRDPTPVVRAYESAGARVFHTAEVGTVEVRIREENYVVTSFRESFGVR